MDRSTDKWPRMTLLLFVLLAGGVAGCSVGNVSEGEKDTGPAADSGVEPDTSRDSGVEDSSDGGDRPDSGQPDVDVGSQPGPTVQTFTSCGAGGVSAGDGLRAIQCYGPSESAGREASGDGVRWQPGAFRVVSE